MEVLTYNALNKYSPLKVSNYSNWIVKELCIDVMKKNWVECIGDPDKYTNRAKTEPGLANLRKGEQLNPSTAAEASRDKFT